MEAGAIGIIGGADGPTAIYLTGKAWPFMLTAGLAVAAVIALLVWLFLKHR